MSRGERRKERKERRKLSFGQKPLTFWAPRTTNNIATHSHTHTRLLSHLSRQHSSSVCFFLFLVYYSPLNPVCLSVRVYAGSKKEGELETWRRCLSFFLYARKHTKTTSKKIPRLLLCVSAPSNWCFWFQAIATAIAKRIHTFQSEYAEEKEKVAPSFCSNHPRVLTYFWKTNEAFL